jgi:Flp pilus assembly protein TadG
VSITSHHQQNHDPGSRSVQPWTTEDGQAMVEFALVLPVLLLVVMGILWFGRALNYTQDETQLANEAARFAAVNNWPGAGSTSLSSYILGQIDTKELKNGSTDVPNPAKMSICFPNGTSNVGDPVKITINSTFHFLPILKLANTNISGSATMRLEAVPTNYSATGPC